MNVGGGNHFAVYILRRHVVGFVSRLGLVSVTPISGYIYIYVVCFQFYVLVWSNKRYVYDASIFIYFKQIKRHGHRK